MIEPQIDSNILNRSIRRAVVDKAVENPGYIYRYGNFSHLDLHEEDTHIESIQMQMMTGVSHAWMVRVSYILYGQLASMKKEHPELDWEQNEELFGVLNLGTVSKTFAEDSISDPPASGSATAYASGFDPVYPDRKNIDVDPVYVASIVDKQRKRQSRGHGF